eukprot:TRINITY_DN26834_c0_g1_i1.p1 TRINITY_DN26834_c0_g1~~TRINITY_DN26834_c0_g1_i1.p1  ORF type:complete len:299 (+),score=47.82 TRINITY_DN26834_c0_g1_i1:224-1120(+)
MGKAKAAKLQRAPDPEAELDTPQACSLPRDEKLFLRKVSIPLPTMARNGGRGLSKQLQAAEDAAVQQAIATLDKYNMCILHNALSPDALDTITTEFEEMLDLNGDAAIGEKDASKRSGTRMYNCACQVGPNCGFCGWRVGSERTKRLLDLQYPHERTEAMSVWRRVVTEMGVDHVARVEVVTSHRGCRNQDWHVDAPRGLTTIFAMVDVDLPKGPTQMDFTIPFSAILEGAPKVKKPEDAPDTVHAAMPVCSVLMFNANASHRGTANISTGPRPILVLDCSPPCPDEHLLYEDPSAMM